MSIPTDDELFAHARKAAERAHAPYSKFYVGAALLAKDGRIFTGGNVECASYGGTICAERSALVKAVSEGANEFTHIVVYTDTAEPTPPCGICRQMLMDFAPDLRVTSITSGCAKQSWTLSELLPAAFHFSKD